METIRRDMICIDDDRGAKPMNASIRTSDI